MNTQFLKRICKTLFLISTCLPLLLSAAQAQGKATDFIPGIYADHGNGAYFSLYSEGNEFWIEYTPQYDVLKRSTYLLRQISGHFEAQGQDCAGRLIRLSILFQNGILWLSTNESGGRIVPQISPTPWILHTTCD